MAAPTSLALNGQREITPFQEIVQTLSEDPALFKEPAYTAITRLLSYEGRLPIDHGLDSLLDIERAIFSQLLDLPDLRLTPLQSPQLGHTLQIFYNSLGRLHLRPVNEPIPSYPEGIEILPIGHLRLPRVVAAWAEALAERNLAEEVYLREKCDSLLYRKEKLGELDALIEDVDDAVRHVEAVCFYVEDELFSVVERFTTLIDKDTKTGLLSVLRNKPLKDWTPAQRLAVVGLKALFLSGRSIRFEEFNGKRMSARRLFGRLHELAETYRIRGARIDLNDASDPFCLAEAIGKAATQSVGQPWLRYRWINGLTFFKTERVTLAPTPGQVDSVISESMVEFYERWTHRRLNFNHGYEQILSELTDAVIAATITGQQPLLQDTPAKTPLEELIQKIVTSAMFATRADYAMSSSLRDLAPLTIEDDDTRLQAMLQLKPADFYCCIVSRPELSRHLGERIGKHVYGAVQGRMQFNRWHFIAGNFSRAEIPKSRHYFYPPLVPDLAEWSDQHHGGHSRASVRFSIRSPGPDMGEPPLMIANHPYRGFYDIRVVRMEGEPFTLSDMLLARHHCLLMGVVWRRTVAHCVAEPGTLKIVGFQKGEGYEPRPRWPIPSGTDLLWLS